MSYYLIIISLGMFYAFSLCLALRELEQTREARYFIQMWKKWPHTIYIHQYIEDFNKIKSTLTH